jgi:hypothetical protein
MFGSFAGWKRRGERGPEGHGRVVLADPVRELGGVLALERQRPLQGGVVVVVDGDENGQAEEEVGAHLEQQHVVVVDQGASLDVGESEPRGALSRIPVAEPRAEVGLPVGHERGRVGLVRGQQRRVAVDLVEELIHVVQAHRGSPFGYQVKYASIVWKRSRLST